MSVEQIRKRLQNQRGILLALHRQGGLQRSVLSEQLGIRKSSVTSIVSDLLARGVLREEVPGALRSPVALEADKFYAVGVVVEPGRLHLAEVRFDGRLGTRDTVSLPSGGGPDVVLGEVVRRLKERLALDRGGLAGVGVSVPGLVDVATGTGLFAVNLPKWKNVPVRQLLERSLGLPVIVSHDGRSQLLGNTWFSRPQETPRNVIHLCLKEGVSCGVMVEGRVLSGHHFAAGEIGCLPAGNGGRLCACGKKDCLQTYVSIPALASHLRETFTLGGGGTAEDIAAAVAAEPAALATLDRAIAPLADKVSTAMALVDPDVLLVGTESVRLSETLVPLLRKRLDIDLRGIYARPADVRAGAPVTVAALRGIAAMVMEDCFARGEFASSAAPVGA